MTALTLHYHPLSSYCQKVLIAIDLLGVRDRQATARPGRPRRARGLPGVVAHGQDAAAGGPGRPVPGVEHHHRAPAAAPRRRRPHPDSAGRGRRARRAPVGPPLRPLRDDADAGFHGRPAQARRRSAIAQRGPGARGSCRSPTPSSTAGSRAGPGSRAMRSAWPTALPRRPCSMPRPTCRCRRSRCSCRPTSSACWHPSVAADRPGAALLQVLPGRAGLSRRFFNPMDRWRSAQAHQQRRALRRLMFFRRALAALECQSGVAEAVNSIWPR